MTFTFDTRTSKSYLPYESIVGGSYNPNVSYHYNDEVSHYHYGVHHPMKPFRLLLTDHLVSSYGMHELMDLYHPRAATRDELLQFHSEDYIDFLAKVTPDSNKSKYEQFNIGPDCPIFHHLYDYSALYAGASLDATRKLISGASDIAINWSGGLHHAKKTHPSGFCYVNDIVLSILNLLRVHPRVLYIDIDLHHGDGVQEAFYTTDRVFTVSFHKYNGVFFPGTGALDETGVARGKHYALNVPLQDGISDESYISLFKSIMDPLITTYQPTAVVLQCGADSLGGDRLGCFNLNIKAHGACASFIKSFNLPMLVVGGGGYTPRNVSRLWAHETAVMNDVILQNELPQELQWENEWRGQGLYPELGGHWEDKNTKGYLEDLRLRCLETIRFIGGAPSVEMWQLPPDFSGLTEEEDERLRDEMQDRMADTRE